jgi:hypothetical protein
MEKIFKNDFDQIISEYLAAELGKYTIDFVDSGNLRKVEHYSQNRLDAIDHYRVGNETDSAILASLGTAIVSNVAIQIVDVENYGNYMIHTYIFYIKGIESPHSYHRFPTIAITSLSKILLPKYRRLSL